MPAWKKGLIMEGENNGMQAQQNTQQQEGKQQATQQPQQETQQAGASDAGKPAGDSGRGGKNYVEDLQAKEMWCRWNADMTAKVNAFGCVNFSGITDPARLLVLARRVLQSDIVGIDGNLTTAASITVVENAVTEAIDDLDDLGGIDF